MFLRINNEIWEINVTLSLYNYKSDFELQDVNS